MRAKSRETFERIARRWNAHLANMGYVVIDKVGHRSDLTGDDVATMLADVQLARIENDPRSDGWRDLAATAEAAQHRDAHTKPLSGLSAQQTPIVADAKAHRRPDEKVEDAVRRRWLPPMSEQKDRDIAFLRGKRS